MFPPDAVVVVFQQNFISYLHTKEKLQKIVEN